MPVSARARFVRKRRDQLYKAAGGLHAPLLGDSRFVQEQPVLERTDSTETAVTKQTAGGIWQRDYDDCF
jgi:hypothetical protein